MTAPPHDSTLDEQIELVPYDPAWAKAFVAERSAIAQALDLPADSIEHIGSTAVPGLTSKPIIDMMLGVHSIPPPADLLSRLERPGYQSLGEAGVPGRLYLRRRDTLACNLHIVERGGIHWLNNLALRDLLLRDSDWRARYAAAKQAAVARSGARLLAYSAAKHGFVSELLAAAQKR